MPFRLKVSLAILLGMLSLAVFGPFIVRIRPLPDTVPEHQLADPDSRFVEVDGLELHYKRAGEGTPSFVLLHGFGTSTTSWQTVMDDFARTGTAVAFDRPAFGLSERPLPGSWDEPNPYAPETQVELTLGLMDALGLEQAILVGHASGGTVAAQVAAAHPERVAGLVLVDAVVYETGRRSLLSRLFMRLPQVERLGPLLARQLGGAAGSEFLRSGWSDPDQLDEATLEAYSKAFRAENWDVALWEYLKANSAGGADLEPQLPSLTVRTLVITGADDKIVPPESSERLASDLPNATLAVLETCGHFPQEECPAAFIEAVTAWLSTQALLPSAPSRNPAGD